MYAYIYANVYMHTYAYTYIHTCIHTYVFTGGFVLIRGSFCLGASVVFVRSPFCQYASDTTES